MLCIFITEVFKNRHFAPVFLIIIVFLIFTTPHVAAQVKLDFENLPANTSVTTQYSSQGVLFNNTYIDTEPAASSGTQVLRAGFPGEEFHSGPLRVSFLNGQSRVSFLAGTNWPGDGTLRAFDADDNLIDQDGPKTVALNAFTTLFEVSVATPSIVRIEFEVGVTTFEAFDDLEIYGEPPGPLPTTPPVVRLTSPTQNQQLTSSLMTLEGEVTGEGVVGARYNFRMKQPNESQAPTTTGGAIQLSGSGNQRTFSMIFTTGLGPQTLTVSAENTAGLSHSDSVQVTYLPQAIRERVAMEGEATLGNFLFGGYDRGCSYVVYEQGAIGLVGGNSYVVRDEILGKWRSEKDSNGYPDLGCPISEKRNIPGENVIAQDFQKARIYADANGTFLVPTIFVEAIDSRGGEADIGIPMEDPRESTGVMQTWLFQSPC